MINFIKEYKHHIAIAISVLLIVSFPLMNLLVALLVLFYASCIGALVFLEERDIIINDLLSNFPSLTFEELTIPNITLIGILLSGMLVSGSIGILTVFLIALIFHYVLLVPKLHKRK